MRLVPGPEVRTDIKTSIRASKHVKGISESCWEGMLREIQNRCTVKSMTVCTNPVCTTKYEINGLRCRIMQLKISGLKAFQKPQSFKQQKQVRSCLKQQNGLRLS